MTEHKSAESLAKSYAADVSWAKTPDRTVRTANARKAADARFLALAGGDVQRAAKLRQVHYKAIQLKSIAVRKARAEARRKQNGAA